MGNIKSNTKMVSLKVQKRLASAVLKCGKRRLWLDPNECSEIKLATSRRTMKKLVKDGLVVRRQVHTHSRAKARDFYEQKKLGRHTGTGKRLGAKNARMPSKLFWVRRQRLLRKLRKNRKIDKNLYHKFYLGSKGNLYKNKKVLIEAIHKERNEKLRQEKIDNEQKARRQKAKEVRERKMGKKVANIKAAQE